MVRLCHRKFIILAMLLLSLIPVSPASKAADFPQKGRSSEAVQRAHQLGRDLSDRLNSLVNRFNDLGNAYGALDELRRILSEMDNVVFNYKTEMEVLLVDVDEKDKGVKSAVDL